MMKRFMFQGLAVLRGIAIMAFTVAALIGVVWGLSGSFSPKEEIPDAATPSRGFKAEDWFAYLREHHEAPECFYSVSANEQGIVWIRPEACDRLQEITGGLPEEFFYGKFEDGVYWKFDFAQDKYVRDEEWLRRHQKTNSLENSSGA